MNKILFFNVIVIVIFGTILTSSKNRLSDKQVSRFSLFVNHTSLLIWTIIVFFNISWLKIYQKSITLRFSFLSYYQKRMHLKMPLSDWNYELLNKKTLKPHLGQVGWPPKCIFYPTYTWNSFVLHKFSEFLQNPVTQNQPFLQVQLLPSFSKPATMMRCGQNFEVKPRTGWPVEIEPANLLQHSDCDRD